MKPRLILLFTPDRTFDQLVREAFSLVEIWIKEEFPKKVSANLNRSRYCQYD